MSEQEQAGRVIGFAGPGVEALPMTLGDIRDCVTGARLLSAVVDTVKGGIQMRRIHRLLQGEVDGLQEVYDKLLDRHGVKGDDGELIKEEKDDETVTVKLVDPEAFIVERDALYAEPIVVNVNPVKLSELGDIDGKLNGIGEILGALIDAGFIVED
jgi:hypothetical protein